MYSWLHSEKSWESVALIVLLIAWSQQGFVHGGSRRREIGLPPALESQVLNCPFPPRLYCLLLFFVSTAVCFTSPFTCIITQTLFNQCHYQKFVTHRPSVCLSLPLSLSVYYLPLYQFVCLYLSSYQPTYIYLSICISISLSVCLPIYLYF